MKRGEEGMREKDERRRGKHVSRVREEEGRGFSAVVVASLLLQSLLLLFTFGEERSVG